MVGGDPNVDAIDQPMATTKYDIPEYKEPQNNPMIPNEQKRIYNDSKPRNQSMGGQEPLLNLQLFQPPRPPKPMAPAQQLYPNPAVFYPNYVPNPFDPIGYQQHMQQQYGVVQPVFKEYNINIGGIEGSHVQTAMLFEDAMPAKNVAGSFTSVGERVTMYEYIRAIMFPAGDGADVAIEGDSKNLLSHLKFMDINPYNCSRFTKNPYKGLPIGYLIYRSCYPIRHDARNATAICATNSTGINVRIYKITEGSYMINKQPISHAQDYDEWRDTAFYNFVKEHILKKKVCPNFPLMYGYNITLKSGIKFDDLKIIQGQNTEGLRDDQTRKLPSKIVNPTNTMTVVTYNRQPVQVNLDAYTGKAMVLLTEACNYSLMGWSKLEYRSDGNIKRMINSGYHTKAVWEGVIFQLLSALYCMQLKGIIINDFKLDRNVFIKDITLGGTVVNYWKYKINGIEYYVPNHGYLVMIDSNFRDFDKPIQDRDMTCTSRTRKLEGKFLANNKLSDEEIRAKTFEMMCQAVNPNNFDQDFVNDNGIRPPEEIIRLLTNIKNDADGRKELDISYYIRRFMTMFLNNRVGSLLKTDEITNIKEGGVKEFRKGQIVTYQDSDGLNRFVTFVDIQPGGNGLARIITKDNIDPKISNIIEKDVPISSLNEYSIVENVKQTFNMNESNLNEENLLETYTIV